MRMIRKLPPEHDRELHPIFGRSVDPIPTRICPPFTTGTPKIFHLPASLYQIHLFYVLIGLCITPLPTTEKSGKPQRELRCSCLQFDKVSYCLEFGIMDFNENGLQWPALVTEKSIKIQHQMTNSVKLPPTNAPKMGLQNDFPFPTHKQRKTFAS